MESVLRHDRPPNRVTAVFEGGAFSLEMSGGATLEDLARRLGHIGERYDEALTAVHVAKVAHEPSAITR